MIQPYSSDIPSLHDMDIPLSHLVIYILAVWRISSLFVRESGPFRMFVFIREQAGIQHDESGTPWLIPDNFTAQLLGCVWCFSLWVGFVFIALIDLAPEFMLKFSIIFAFSAGAILLDSFIQKYR